MMRLDIYLKNTGLIKQRSEAKKACQAGRVRIGAQSARASQAVRPGQVICIETETRYLEVEVLDLPQRPPSRQERGRFYRVLRQAGRDPYADLSF
jgi:ribosomal 50S subunit-recycling heat shock protein